MASQCKVFSILQWLVAIGIPGLETMIDTKVDQIDAVATGSTAARPGLTTDNNAMVGILGSLAAAGALLPLHVVVGEVGLVADVLVMVALGLFNRLKAAPSRATRTSMPWAAVATGSSTTERSDSVWRRVMGPCIV
jgi:hypothetical protein